MRCEPRWVSRESRQYYSHIRAPVGSSVAVCEWRSGAGVPAGCDFNISFSERSAGSLLGESADADDSLDAEDVDHLSKVIVAPLKQGVSGGSSDFVGRDICCPFPREKHQRAMIHDADPQEY